MDDSTEYLKQFARERGMAWPQIQQTGDAGTELLVRYGVRGIPMSYLIDRPFVRAGRLTFRVAATARSGSCDPLSLE
jgi:hypothetical protein